MAPRIIRQEVFVAQVSFCRGRGVRLFFYADFLNGFSVGRFETWKLLIFEESDSKKVSLGVRPRCLKVTQSWVRDFKIDSKMGSRLPFPEAATKYTFKQLRSANLARNYHIVMPKVLVLEAQGRHVMWSMAKFWPEKITSRDGCFLLIRGLYGWGGEFPLWMRSICRSFKGQHDEGEQDPQLSGN